MRLHRAEMIPMTLVSVALLSAGLTLAAPQQWTPQKRGSDNIEVVSHLPLGPALSVADIEIEQELSRPYAYVAREVFGREGEKGMDIIDLHDPAHAEVIYRWRIENQDLHVGAGGKDIKYFKWNDRYYVVLSVQFGQGGPNADLGAVVFDVTGLPDPSTVEEVARLREPELPGGFHNIFIYKHSNDRVLLFSTVSGPFAHVYDLGYVVEGRADEALVAQVPVPGDQATAGRRGYHDFYVGYHVDTETDRFYGGGTGGYYVYDITDLENPQLLVSLTGINGVERGHTFTPSPDGRYVVAETEYQYAPLRIFDLKPGLDGEVQNIRQPISAWTADWRHLAHNHEVRWPFVFVSGYLDGLQVFSLMDPHNPVTVAYYDTYLGAGNPDGNPMFDGVWGVDVRNADGLIVVSDMTTGFWAFRMEGFQGWSGESWGLPNISSAQDWEYGPAGAAQKGSTGRGGRR
ncbi:MAG: LVIVD repeat-containing protein [Acidobacteriota bacterium]